ncbi:hypothetical protein T484DRAFT_1901592 [Baffinella frigidus]|nr:hypothetical protein T484DRAFT_1901592 [Cryptophyta sp. CCMP2293]
MISLKWPGGQNRPPRVPRQVLGPYCKAYEPTRHLRDSKLGERTTCRQLWTVACQLLTVAGTGPASESNHTAGTTEGFRE